MERNPAQVDHAPTGSRIKVYWAGDKEWYPAVILSYNARTGKHKVKYEADQFVEELKLSEEEVQMCEDEREPKRQKMASKAASKPGASTSFEHNINLHGLDPSSSGADGQAKRNASNDLPQSCEVHKDTNPLGPVEGWTIRAWLEAKGLVKYAGLFELNEVDMVVLPTLTLEDLKDMPVKAVGARRKILDGIFKLAELKRVEEAESPVVEASNERDTHTNEDTDVLVQTALKAGEPEEDFMPKGNTGKGGPLEATDKPASEIQ
ncbi:hypothetical protein CYMTET_21249 [Cymbomonas tetramitiformis]|uniref:SAM domain-containing protein n=1 Tax=Cymbomonas tetramitiformis TaxID=36881 RepID=A0AAE0G3R3_9CHLO|nr:hypothetical protein CYMTET_21249 [Cymbomonas tetramitiformis]